MKKQEIVKILKDIKQIELFDNPNYARIVSILRRGELTIKEIHKLFNKDYEDRKTLTSIYRYMETLLENDLVFVSKEELMKGHLVERYYSRTALIFLFEDEKFDEDAIIATSELLQQLYNLDTERTEESRKFLRELVQDVNKSSADFFETYGKDIFGLEKKYGFDAVKHAAKQIHQLMYYRENSEKIEKIFEILGVDF